jgi:SagB-type dehydrogenase family enzyme
MPAPRLRRAESVLAYWHGGRLAFLNFALRRSVAADPPAISFLAFFDRWRTAQDAVRHFDAYSSASVRRTIRQFLEHGLLVAERSPESELDRRIAREWSAWLPEGAFHFATKDAAYVRSNWSRRRLMAALPSTPQPAKFKTIKDAQRLSLPERKFPESEFIDVLMARRTHRRFSRRAVSIETVSQLLSLVWGFTGHLDTSLFGKLPRRTSPSGGARHPGEVYVMALRVQGLRPGLYHYHSARHRLELVGHGASPARAARYCAHQEYAGNAAALFLMTAVFPRAMWKYHRPRAYRVVLLDAGHLAQTFCLVATWLGLAPFCTAALKDSLIEQDLRIDGVRESILYVVGVGLPPRDRRPAAPYELRAASMATKVRSRSCAD